MHGNTPKSSVKSKLFKFYCFSKIDVYNVLKHMLENPGHDFNLDSAKILWKTRNVIEQKMVEAACISELPNCNTSKGEIPVNSIVSSLIMRLTDIPKFMAGTDHGNSPSHSSLHPLPRVPQPPRPVQPSASQPLPSISQLHTLCPPPTASIHACYSSSLCNFFTCLAF